MSSTGGNIYSAGNEGGITQQCGSAYSNPTTGVSNTNGSDASQSAMETSKENQQTIAPE